MAVTSTPVFPQTLKNYVVTIVNADASTLKTVAAGGTNGTKIESLLVSSTELTANNRDLAIYVTISATDYLLTTIQIPFSAGFTNAIPAVDLLRHTQMVPLPVDANGNRYFYLANGSTLKVSSTTTVTSGKTLTVFAFGEDF